MNSHNAIPYPDPAAPGAIIGWYWSPEFIAARLIAEESLWDIRTPTPGDLDRIAQALLFNVEMAAGVTGMPDSRASSIAAAAFNRYTTWLTVQQAAGADAIDPKILASFTYGPVLP